VNSFASDVLPIYGFAVYRPSDIEPALNGY
jgi:hypothetical protein